MYPSIRLVVNIHLLLFRLDALLPVALSRVFLSIHPFMCLSIYISAYPSIHSPCIDLSICPLNVNFFSIQVLCIGASCCVTRVNVPCVLMTVRRWRAGAESLPTPCRV